MGTRAGAPAERTPNTVRRARTRAAILDAAETRMVEYGLTATTIDSVAPMAGVSKGAVYFHFSSKEDLLLAILERSRRTVFDPALAILEDASCTPTERLVGYFNGIGSLQQLNRYLVPVLAAVQGAGVPPDARQHISDLRAGIHSSLVDTIAAGQSSGEFTSAVGQRELATLTMGLMDGLLLQWYRSSDTVDGPQLLRAGRHALFGALAGGRPHTR